MNFLSDSNKLHNRTTLFPKANTPKTEIISFFWCAKFRTIMFFMVTPIWCFFFTFGDS